MLFPCARAARPPRFVVWSGGLLLGFAGWLAGPVHGQVSDVVRVEEDWELVLATPDSTGNSPQVTCAMSPSDGDDSEYASFELNYQSQPSYAAGGLHIHAWNGEYLRASTHTQAGVQLQTSNEVVQWTQSMEVADGLLTYEVSNGSSTTWGSFGSGELKLTVATRLENLNGYNLQSNSLTGSGVGYGANRVKSLVLKRLRAVLRSGAVYEFSVNYDVLNH